MFTRNVLPLNLQPERSLDRRLRRPAPGPVPNSARARLMLQRLDRRRLLALLLALAVAWMVASVVSQANGERAALGNQLDVVVARNPLAVGQVVEAGDIETRSVPASYVPDGYLAAEDAASLIGATVRSPIGEGEMVVESRLVTGADLGPDERAITIPQPLAPPPLAAGDVVELLAVTVIDGAFVPSSTMLGSCRVLAFGNARGGDIDSTASGNAGAEGITVACSQATAISVMQQLAVGPVEVLRTPFSS